MQKIDEELDHETRIALRGFACKKCGERLALGIEICPFCKTLPGSPNKGVLASPIRRFLGALLDILIGWVGFLVLAVQMERVLLPLGIIGFIFIYYWTQSTSPGKAIAGMKVYRIDGQPLGFFMTLLRDTIGRTVSTSFFSLGFIWVLIDEKNRAWHDIALNSLVVKTRL